MRDTVGHATEAEPVSVYVNTMGTGSVEDDIISHRVASLFDFRPQAIIEKLSLRTPIYSSSASGGHLAGIQIPRGDSHGVPGT